MKGKKIEKERMKNMEERERERERDKERERERNENTIREEIERMKLSKNVLLDGKDMKMSE